MQRGRALFWTVIGSVVAVVAVVIALILVNSGTPPKAASSPVPSISASAGSPAGKPAPVVIPKTSSTSSFSYLADLTPSGNLGELVNPGPVKIDGSIYPKSILFYCNVGDPTAFPAYKLEHNARRFQATIGLEAKFPPHFEAGVILIGDGRTLRTFSVSVRRPKTVDVNVTGIHTLQLECFGSGQSSISRLGRCCSVGQRTCHRTTLTAKWRVVLAGLRPGDRPGGERHSRGGEGGRGEDAGVAGGKRRLEPGWDI